MKKYNRSEIMKRAWNLFHMSQKWVDKLSFSECLRRSWKEAKESAKAEEIMSTEKYFYMNIGMATVHVNVGDRIVSGNTYKCKDVLKRYGLTFNGHEKYWEGTREQIMDLVKYYA